MALNNVINLLHACRLDGGYTSYIDVPRINFAGFFHADIPTGNLNVSNYAYAAGYTEYEFAPRWNVQGTGDFSLINCTVRSVTYTNGSTSVRDSVVGSRVVVNKGLPSAKLTGLHFVDKMLGFSTLYGMELALMKGNTSLFKGTSAEPLNLDQDSWTNVPCAPRSGYSIHWRISVHSSGRLKDVTWFDHGSQNEVLQQMQAVGGDLSVALTLYNQCPVKVGLKTSPYEESLECENIGYLVGTIGVIGSKLGPPVDSSMGGNRIMTFSGVEQPLIAWPQQDPCSNPQLAQGMLLMYKAPFSVDMSNKMVRVAFSNAFSKNIDGFSLRDFGSDLILAVLDDQLSCVHVLVDGTIPYRKAGWFENSAGMFDASLTDKELELVKDKPLVVVRLVPAVENKSATEYPPCTKQSGKSPRYQLMLKESPYYVRPLGYYGYYMEAGDTINMSFYVTYFGQPSADTTVIVNQTCPAEGVATRDGVAALQQEVMTDSQGIANFSFAAKSYKHFPQCGLDRQSYAFIYKVKEDWSNCFVGVLAADEEAPSSFYQTCINELGFLLWRDDSKKYKPPYSWQDHVGPIFSQYDILYPVMRALLNLSNFTDVTQARNLRLIRYGMKLDSNHPSYMPVTRDLSPTKRAAIIEWLGDPLYESPVSLLSSDIIALCNVPVYFPSDSKETAICSSDTVILHPYFAECAHFDWESTDPSALAEWQKDALTGTCTLDGLQRQLQQALQVEFATVPLYLTALYSIKEGYNGEVYSIIRTVVMQEMMHFTQVGNLLIAVGGNPQIDNETAVPQYPRMGLPGNIFPGLNITLKKASREHIYEVFMALEHPHLAVEGNSSARSSIGDLYDQILRCMEFLQDKGQNIFSNPRTERQIPWTQETEYMQLYIIRNLEDAQAAISIIREQGEGATPVNPTFSDSSDLAHFYKFEEIVCGRRLVYDRLSNRHSFIGEPVEFDPKGVWPMRDNPSKEGLTPGTRAYTVARAFHTQYRNLLQQLQSVFNGDSGGILDTLPIMESLTVYGKRLAALKTDPDLCDSETVGPVWDYNWEE